MNNTHALLRALRLNAIFSSFSAVFLFFAAPWIAAQLGLPSLLPVYIVGAFLVLFALQLANIVRTGNIHIWEVRGIIAGDLAWVLGTVVLVGLFHSSLTTIGLLLVDIIGLAVLTFAILQIRGLRAMRA
jgi:hypothetical protein